jgi:hypothetical protein
MFTVYILYSETVQGYYAGYTSGTMEERLSKHLCSHGGYTSKAKDVCYPGLPRKEKPCLMKKDQRVFSESTTGQTSAYSSRDKHKNKYYHYM